MIDQSLDQSPTPELNKAMFEVSQALKQPAKTNRHITEAMQISAQLIMQSAMRSKSQKRASAMPKALLTKWTATARQSTRYIPKSATAAVNIKSYGAQLSPMTSICRSWRISNHDIIQSALERV